MGKTQLPVLVHMWFKDGGDWAFHPDYVSCFLEVVRSLDRPLKNREMSEFIIPFMGGYLIGERLLQLDCEDPKAVNRRPFILRAAFVDHDPSQNEARTIRGMLKNILPEKRGQSDQLRINV